MVSYSLPVGAAAKVSSMQIFFRAAGEHGGGQPSQQPQQQMQQQQQQSRGPVDDEGYTEADRQAMQQSHQM